MIKRIDEFIGRAFDTATKHGFHDKKTSVEHQLMLVISEIGEAVEADRKNRHANLAGFDKCIGIEYSQRFKDYVKDSVEDELADVVIRIFDFCGLRKITPAMSSKGVLDMQDEFKEIFGNMSVCEQCFALSCLVGDIGRYSEKWDKDRIEREIGAILSFCFDFAKFHGFDLEWHVEHKLRYNESRERLHGKKY